MVFLILRNSTHTGELENTVLTAYRGMPLDNGVWPNRGILPDTDLWPDHRIRADLDSAVYDWRNPVAMVWIEPK